MQAMLFCKTGELSGAEFRMTVEATIGKTPDNTIQLYPVTISRKHARIYYDKTQQCYFIEDTNSRNGTKVDNIPLKKPEKLGRLHVITFANKFDFIFQIVDEPVDLKDDAASVIEAPTQVGLEFPPLPPQASESKDMDFRQPPASQFSPEEKDDPGMSPDEPSVETPSASVEPPTQIGSFNLPPELEPPGPIGSRPPLQPPSRQDSISQFILELENLNGEKNKFDLKNGKNTLGRLPSCDIVIRNKYISRHHAQFNVRGTTVVLANMTGKENIHVDQQPVTSEIELKPGMIIQLAFYKATLIKREL